MLGSGGGRTETAREAGRGAGRGPAGGVLALRGRRGPGRPSQARPRVRGCERGRRARRGAYHALPARGSRESPVPGAHDPAASIYNPGLLRPPLVRTTGTLFLLFYSKAAIPRLPPPRRPGFAGLDRGRPALARSLPRRVGLGPRRLRAGQSARPLRPRLGVTPNDASRGRRALPGARLRWGPGGRRRRPRTRTDLQRRLKFTRTRKVRG